VLKRNKDFDFEESDEFLNVNRGNNQVIGSDKMEM